MNLGFASHEPGIEVDGPGTAPVPDEIFAISKNPASDLDLDPEVGGDDDGPQRASWGNPIEFLLSCIAMSVGLGNVWRFPFIALRNGGGAFLIPYLVVLLVIGRPIYYLEMCLGQVRGILKK